MAQYVAFNQSGRAVMESDSIAHLINGMTAAGYRFYFIANERNEVLVNELKGRQLPRRTSRGTVQEGR